MPNARNLAAAAILLLGAAALRPAEAQSVFLTDTTKVVLLRKLVARTGAVELALASMEATIPAQRAANPKIPGVFWDRFLEQARARRAELADMIVAGYVSYFTADDVRQVLAFYDTPVGSKLLAIQPQVMKQSMEAGQRWGQSIGMDVARQLAAQGVKLEP